MKGQNVANGMGWNEEYQEDKTSKTELEPGDANYYLAERKSGLEFLCLLRSHSVTMTKTSAQVFCLLFMHAGV